MISQSDAEKLVIFIAHQLNTFVFERTQIDFCCLSSSDQLIIPDDTGSKETTIDLSRFGSMKLFSCGDFALTKVRSVMFHDLNQLQSIRIGSNSFTLRKYSVSNQTGTLVIRKCSSLKEITIGEYSFSDYSSLVLSDLVSLQTISISSQAFSYANSFSLTR